MVADSEVLARRMITANILSGKIKAILGVIVRGETLVKAITLNDDDRARIESMTVETMKNIRHGASLTLASVTSMIQKAAVRANMPSAMTSNESDKKKESDEAPKQEPMSREFSGQQVEERRASVSFRETPVSEKELSQIRSNPILYANNCAADNVKAVASLQKEYHAREQENKRIAQQLSGAGKGNNIPRKEVVGMEREMLENGVSAFVDKGGKRWSLINYCSMTARTTSTTSENVGEVFADGEHDLYYVVPHGGSCPLCAKVEGKVYSRSGKNPNYPPLSSIFQKVDPNGTDDLNNTYLVIHPNCRHKIIRYVERGKQSGARSRKKQ